MLNPLSNLFFSLFFFSFFGTFFSYFSFPKRMIMAQSIKYLSILLNQLTITNPIITKGIQA